METISEAFARLAREVDSSTRIGYPLAELNELLTSASGEDVLQLPVPQVRDAYRLNYVTAMVELDDTATKTHCRAPIKQYPAGIEATSRLRPKESIVGR